ncbi:MAG: hypothetical protein AAGO57_02640 [Pseudomonadota bacterium]
MCLTLEALVAFLNLLPADIVETRPEQILVHAEVETTVWEVRGDVWCVELGGARAASVTSEEFGG